MLSFVFPSARESAAPFPPLLSPKLPNNYYPLVFPFFLPSILPIFLDLIEIWRPLYLRLTH